ncbi:hypothetical protein K469DRAFT_726556 [Zopfia rhizophila CBS 207.26]|uniref:DDE-domain-containing protein n=1 Tax=Zopfia rhizophila CBS 207.26 TaxID=1314779 RepID=A0A6A6E4V4_9PEZI|nr:hypothetical protein K469DRAFT_726556 [Zopfia rhizophila CBS 207.26]
MDTLCRAVLAVLTNLTILSISNWPILELILFSWQQQIEYCGGLGLIPEYTEKPIPEFSVGWVDRFKKRHGLKQHISHSELGSAPIIVGDEMKLIQEATLLFSMENVYNMDETRLYCKRKMPRALRIVNIQALSALRAFYFRTRSVILLIDNFSAHTVALELAPPPANIRIEFLPKNSTSMFQPLDQGIIQNFKAYYHKWTLRSWNFKVSTSTIENCWRKSIITIEDTITVRFPVEDLTPLFQEAAQLANTKDVRSFQEFINPEDEDAEEENAEVNLQEIVDYYTRKPGVEQAPEEDDEPEPVPTIYEALIAVQRLQRYQEYQNNANAEDLLCLQRLERELGLQAFNSRKQSTLDSWLQKS